MLRAVRSVDAKCERILGMLRAMRGEEEDSLINGLRESAKDLYLSSLEERKRLGRFFSVTKHD